MLPLSRCLSILKTVATGVGAAVWLAGCSTTVSTDTDSDNGPEKRIEADIPSAVTLKGLIVTPGLYPVSAQFSAGGMPSLAAPPMILRIAADSLPEELRKETDDCWALMSGFGYKLPDSVRFSSELLFCTGPNQTVFEAKFSGTAGTDTVGLGAPGTLEHLTSVAVNRAIAQFVYALPKVLPESLTGTDYLKALSDYAAIKAAVYRRMGNCRLDTVVVNAGQTVDLILLEDIRLTQTPLNRKAKL